MVHEWLEALIRIGAVLYRRRSSNNLIISLKHLFGVMREKLPLIAYGFDLDAYRFGRLYTEAVENVFIEVRAELQALYDCYSMYRMGSKERRGMHFGPARAIFGIDIWNQLLSDA